MDMPGLAILLAKKKPSMKEKDEPMPHEMDDEDMHSKDDTQRAVMKALMEAMKADDVDGALEAWKDLSDVCQGED